MTKFCICIDIDRIWVELWPMIDVRISFQLNILMTNGQNRINFCVCIDIDKILVGIGMPDCLQICNRVISLDWDFLRLLGLFTA